MFFVLIAHINASKFVLDAVVTGNIQIFFVKQLLSVTLGMLCLQKMISLN